MSLAPHQASDHAELFFYSVHHSKCGEGNAKQDERNEQTKGLKRIALVVTWRPHLLDIGVPIDRITSNRERAVECLHFKPLRSERV